MTILRALLRLFLTFGDDILVLSGLAVICWATFLLSFIAGLYVIGVILCGLAVLLAKYTRKPPKRG
ncbi:hypothetical protein GCM10025857_39650 [Alicyclobacillus contaminans]|nr:hypothetical protein GCM10025857_00120 [Alicyclobacillus contaminans]GMA52608.1 hypothetical protein GCM10025857_39650 [Alicyclobacillus contaminans]